MARAHFAPSLMQDTSSPMSCQVFGVTGEMGTIFSPVSALNTVCGEIFSQVFLGFSWSQAALLHSGTDGSLTNTLRDALHGPLSSSALDTLLASSGHLSHPDSTLSPQSREATGFCPLSPQVQ